ncbi:MAG: hypothetical protein ABR970_15065 [Roseiarcus sp.]|jgi:hypothetical protein
MRALLTKGIVAASVGLAMAAALGCAPGPALARSGGRGGAWVGGGATAAGSHGGERGGRFHHYSGSIRVGGHFRGSEPDGAAERGRLAGDGAHFAGHWGGVSAARDFMGWPGASLLRRYGDGDFQPCMRRDVYGDLYQAC